MCWWGTYPVILKQIHSSSRTCLPPSSFKIHNFRKICFVVETQCNVNKVSTILCFGGGGKGGNHSPWMNVVAHNTGPLYPII
jgi:hypothetical protein